MLKSWRHTDNLNLAVALATCGIPIVPLSTLDEVSGRRVTTYDLGESGHLPAPEIPPDDPQRIRERFNLYDGPNLPQTMATGPLRKMLEDPTMQMGDPEHPALDVLMTLHARECLLTFMNRGTRYRIQAHPSAPRARYVEGQEPMVAKLRQPGFETWHTADLAVAAAMVRIGVPVLDIVGTKPNRSFVLPRYGYTLQKRFGPDDARELFRLLISGELARYCPEHPLVWGKAGVKNRLDIQQHTERGGSASQVLLRLPRSSGWQKFNRSALVEERAKSSAFDLSLKHLRAQ